MFLVKPGRRDGPGFACPFYQGYKSFPRWAQQSSANLLVIRTAKKLSLFQGGLESKYLTSLLGGRQERMGLELCIILVHQECLPSSLKGVLPARTHLAQRSTLPVNVLSSARTANWRDGLSGHSENFLAGSLVKCPSGISLLFALIPYTPKSLFGSNSSFSVNLRPWCRWDHQIYMACQNCDDK